MNLIYLNVSLVSVSITVFFSAIESIRGQSFIWVLILFSSWNTDHYHLHHRVSNMLAIRAQRCQAAR